MQKLIWCSWYLIIYSREFQKLSAPQSSVLVSRIDNHNPSSYWGSTLYGNPHSYLICCLKYPSILRGRCPKNPGSRKWCPLGNPGADVGNQRKMGVWFGHICSNLQDDENQILFKIVFENTGQVLFYISFLSYLRGLIICGMFYTMLSGWWFGTYLIFPYIQNNHPNLPMFSEGWLNHQPGTICPFGSQSRQIRFSSQSHHDFEREYAAQREKKVLILWLVPSGKVTSLWNITCSHR